MIFDEASLRALIREERALMPAPSRWDGKLYLTLEEAGQIVGVDYETVRGWVKSGELPQHGKGSRIVRVRRDELEAFLRRGGAERTTSEVDLDEKARQIVAGHIGKVRSA